jgi:anti-sigma factor RsiW
MSPERILAEEITAFIDGELELTRQLALEARLAADSALREQVQGLRALRDAVRERADYHSAPAALRMQLHLPTPSAAPAAAGRIRAEHSGWRQWFAWRPLSVACALVAGLALTLSLTTLRSGGDERLMQEVIASHVRSSMGDKLVDVASSDQHTVKPWLSSKLDFSPPVGDVAMPSGINFVGGRVDYLDGRPVAALVYRQRKHVIDAYIWPSAQSDTQMQPLSQRGFNVVHWTQGGMRFWVVSDLQRDELAVFARSLAQADAAR